MLSRLNTSQQFVAFALILLGSQAWIAACVVNVQRALLARKIQRRCEEEKEKRREEAGKVLGGEDLEKLGAVVTPHVTPSSPPVLLVSPVESAVPMMNGFATQIVPLTDTAPPMNGCVIANVPSSSTTLVVSSVDTSQCTTPALSRNGSNVVLLNQNESTHNVIFEENQDKSTLSALTMLSWLLPTYLVAFQLLGTICIGAWVSRYGPDIVAANNLHPWWFAAFNSVSAFNNSGMSLLDANMVPFATRGSLVVWVQCILILAGNSGLPVFLKAIVSLLPDSGGRTLLCSEKAHKAFPYLFPTRETRWLIAMLIILNTIDWTVFEIFARSTPSVLALPVVRRILAGLFQAFSVRSGGFAIVAIRELHTGTLMVYTVMLYISAFPITLPSSVDGARGFVVQQLRGLMRAGDLRYLAAAVWLICVIDGIGGDGVFAVVFEVASAFGCVGVSFGSVMDGRLALVGDWKGMSKVCLAAVMLWGRVREVRRGVLVGWGEKSEEEERHKVGEREREKAV